MKTLLISVVSVSILCCSAFAVPGPQASSVTCDLVKQLPDTSPGGGNDPDTGAALPPNPLAPVTPGAKTTLATQSVTLPMAGPTEILLSGSGADSYSFRAVYLGSAFSPAGGMGYAEVRASGETNLLEAQLMDWSKSADGRSASVTFWNEGSGLTRYLLNCSLN